MEWRRSRLSEKAVLRRDDPGTGATCALRPIVGVRDRVAGAMNWLACRILGHQTEIRGIEGSTEKVILASYPARWTVGARETGQAGIKWAFCWRCGHFVKEKM